jgi:hypothetical protein
MLRSKIQLIPIGKVLSVYLRDFFLWGYSQSGALLDVAQQNPVNTNWKSIICLLEGFFSLGVFSKRSFAGCCAAKSS